MNGALKRGSKGEFVQLMQEMLKKLGYTISTDGDFGSGTEKAVFDFQKKNNLKVDGIVGSKTWILMQEQSSKIKKADTTVVINQFLREQDFVAFANKYNLEVAAIKAVHEVESNGRGFLNGKIKILFEGHVFWKELQKRNINPIPLQNGNEDILYKSYFSPNPHYRLDQYTRLNKALNINAEAAYSAASYGLFQVMGYHYKAMQFAAAKDFVDYLSVDEANQLDIFGRFLELNNLLKTLHSLNWAKFALGYNGTGYKTNKYDTKLATAYAKYKKI
jgi:peptidoglycan hydrolase-like protein with peptidoglycan-binding domain